MIERLALTLLILAVSGLAFAAFRQWQRHQASSVLTAAPTQRSILYFRSDACAPCVTQKRFLEELAASQDVNIETIDVMREPERASAFNILTLPTTIVVGDGGRVKEINYGLTNAAKLAQQLA